MLKAHLCNYLREGFSKYDIVILKLLIATTVKVYSLHFVWIHHSLVYKCRVLSMLWSLSFLEAMHSILKTFKLILLLHLSFKAYKSVLSSCGDYEVLILFLLVMQIFCHAQYIYSDKEVFVANQMFVKLHTAYLLQVHFCFTLANQCS